MKITTKLLLLKRTAPIAATLLVAVDATLILWQAYERVIPLML